MDQQDSEHFHIKEEQEELLTSLEREHLHFKEEAEVGRFLFNAVSIKSEEDEHNPLVSQLRQQQIEDRDVTTSSSADQLTAETSWNLDLNSSEQTSGSSETEVSGDNEEDDDVNVVSELSDSVSASGDGDHDWNENRSCESDVKTVNKSFSCPEGGKQFLHKGSLQEHVRATSCSAKWSSSSLVNKKCVTVKQHVDSRKSRKS
ncbi:uncharacterized protein [Nothobranchius furzeri]|uniref:uncharacterized protein isoform X2 n=1 Tax=Nothobranchius furzeri TaxID=105023 RepID=UPI003904D7F5